MNAAQPSLLADIGGTNTRVALALDGIVQRETVTRYANAKYDSLPAILRTYLDAQGVATCAGACLAVAGPIRESVAEMTNLSWRITDKAVSEATGAGTVAFINDLQAQGHALDRLPATSFREIVKGPAERRPGARLVIGLGTGFNAAPVHKTRHGTYVAPSECGHVTLPVRTETDLRLAHFVEKEHGFAGVEDVLSGRGLVHLYGFCAAEAGVTDQPDAAEIMRRIAEGKDEVAVRTGRMFLAFFGRVVGDLALIHLPFGGLYLIGGVARAFAPYFATHGFVEAFRDKGRFETFLGEFSVGVIEDDYAALEGCADHLQSRLAG